MASGDQDDEEALRWEGDDGAPALPDRGAPKGWRTVEGSGDAPVPGAAGASGSKARIDTGTVGPPASGPDDDEDANEAPALGSVALVSLGLLGGIYLLYTVGWILGGTRLLDAAAFLVEPSAVVPAVWVAFAAPALWFGTSLVLTRHRAPWVRLAWLAAGAFLLVPWPFVMGV